MPSIGARSSTKLILSSGDGLDVAGSPEDVAKLLQNAARSSPGTLAWLSESGSGDPVGVNPAHVVTVKAAATEAER